MAPRTPTTEPLSSNARRLPIGVEVLRGANGATRTHARLWAPTAKSAELVIEAGEGREVRIVVPLDAEANGYHSGFVDEAVAGTRYRFQLDGGEGYPDPVSRFQPDGPHGASQVIDPFAYEWTDKDWRGISIDGQVIYEMHVGTFTRAGGFRGAIDRLPDLVDIGVTAIEVMPIADFVGQFGWGYDGVDLFAPSRLYGTPDDFRAFVDAAHRMELAVLLDVVYNHLGPDGNYLTKFAPRYFSGQHTEWGDALNFDGGDAKPVREFFVSNARYWIEEFHLDGLRLDATQQIWDKSSPHILAEVTRAARQAGSEAGRKVVVVGENEPQDAALVRDTGPRACSLDALWNDDFHHAARVAATGRDEAYYGGYRGVSQEFVSAAKYGYLYQSSWYTWQHGRRGTPALDLPPTKFIVFTQNHDQVANTGTGRRLHQETSPGRYRALTALLLLSPQTPMLFQGQEFAASTPFLYFADHTPELAKMVRSGREQFMAQFPSIATPEGRAMLDDPADTQTFLRSKLDWSERQTNKAALALHRDLLRLRREDPVFRHPRARGVDGAVIDDHAFILRYFGGELAGDQGGDQGDRLLVVNLGARLHADPYPEPLAAPPAGQRWTMAFSTELPTYGGNGTPALETEKDGWRIPGECAVLFRSTNVP